MGFLRRSLVTLCALAFVLGTSGIAPSLNAHERHKSSDQLMASMEPGQAMPDCPDYNPDRSMGSGCIASCVTPTAILPIATIIPIVFKKHWQVPPTSSRLADAASGPEPPRPKSTPLA
jgi:hypothetical protein